MPIVSYAQHGEDIRLDWLFPDESDGFYVDVGANDPTFLSVTKHFYDRGWHGVNVEPVPSLYGKLRTARPRDVTLNAGLSDRDGALTFYESSAISGWSTFSPELAAHYRRRGLSLTERTVPVLTLTELFARHVDRPVDFLKIDVEGNEADVVRGIDWSVCRPRVMVIENAWPDDWAHLIPESDYLTFAVDDANRYYVRRDEPGLLASAVNGSRPEGREYVRHVDDRQFERTLAGLASRDDLGPVRRALRRGLFRTLHVAQTLRRGRRSAG